MNKEREITDKPVEQDPPDHLGADLLQKGLAEDPDYRGEHPEPRFFITDETEDDFGGRMMTLNLGPQHPATHGTLRVTLKVRGEKIIAAATEIGFLHTGFEKLAEHMSYQQWVTVTDRMNYMSAMNNNVGYAIACEQLLGVEVPRRAQVIRVILSEFSRLADHIVCNGLAGMDVGAFSLMLWAFERREKVYDLMEAVTGTRLTTSYTRIGGVFRDLPEDFDELAKNIVEEFRSFLEEMRSMTIGNRIFEDRMRGVGVIRGEDAINWGITGPILRASGVAYDVRKAMPYSGYERYDFEIPTQEDGDSYARFVQRLAECEQSLDIICQALEDLPDGPVLSEDKKISLPEKDEVHQNIESLIHHFKQIMFGHGILPERGREVYSATESPNGELGYYMVSDGEMNSYKTRVRPPSIFHFAVLPQLIEGSMISDAIAVLGTLNVIAGELDR